MTLQMILLFAVMAVTLVFGRLSTKHPMRTKKRCVIVVTLILGTPTVTTDCTGMRELLGDSEYGVITDMDAEALADGLCRLLSDEKLLSNYTERAARKGRRFSASASAAQTGEFFKALIDGGNTQA